jgi:hypothetical protein
LGVGNNDWSKGSFWQNTFGNDSPYFIDWYETSELITPLTDIDFYASVFDIDNGTTEINITIYYTFSTFAYENYSVDLVYDSNPSSHIYRYIYQFAGQIAGITMRYYYQAYDGENIVREGYPTYFEITWSYPPVTVERPLPPDVDYERPIFEVPNYLLIFTALMGLLLVIAIFMNMTKRRIESV